MSDLLDLPRIEVQGSPVVAPVTSIQPLDLEKLDLSSLAVAKFGDWRGDVAKARKTLDGAVHDLTTQAKVDEAKSLRFRLIGQPRADVRKVSKALKSKLAAVSKVVGAEEDAAVSAYDAAETLITPQIEAREAELTAERVERERIAAERQQKQAEGVAGIRGYLTRAQTAADMTAERVGNGIKMLESMTFAADDWLDPVAAANAQCETLEGMRALHTTLEAREAEAARLEAQRVENERQAAALAQAQAQLRAEQQRVARITAMIQEIRDAATGHADQDAAALLEARTAVAALNVGAELYQEFAVVAQAEKAATLAVLDKLHGDAVAAEVKRAAALQEVIDAAKAMADAIAAAEVERVLAIPLPLTIPEETTEGQDSPQVLKAEPATADATAGEDTAITSPRVGAMGAGQAADAAPAAELLLQDECRELSKALSADPAAPLHAREAVAAIEAAAGDQSAITEAVAEPGPQAAFLALVMSAFDCKFPSHPKPSQEWWTRVRAAGQQLQGAAA